MPIPSRQIGWSTQDNLLWQIAKQMEQAECQLCDLNENIQNISGGSGTSGTSGVSGTSGSSGTSAALPATVSYGLFAQTANSIPVTGTTTETTLINGGVGTLSVPANGFTVGDSFVAVMAGIELPALRS